METINIKFDEKQLEEVVKKVTEKLKKEKEACSSCSFCRCKLKLWLIGGRGNSIGKLYFGHAFHTLSKNYASEFYLSSESDLIKALELKSQGWKEEVIE
ncbi:hypothetical protein LPJV50_ORF35 [Lactococcus virus jj50]|uniref:Uncharacterized protein n=1 Tax=Lactococcus virus jj50 TaxID=213775 RepID=Q09WL5_9CAUD|nr:hypothetical protein LPJV50_ORF35 [Lactococcus virus jj50]ABB77656.1 hypothetical protein [Lactococcus virus jj50]